MTDSSTVTAGTNGTATQYNNLRKDALLNQKIVGTETDGATVTFDMDDVTKGDFREVTLGGNRTLAVSNFDVGQRVIISLKQDGTGSRTVTWFSGISWPAGVTPTLTTTAGKRDVFGILKIDSSPTYIGTIIAQNV